MGMYDKNETNPELEKSGVWMDYGDYRVLIARAGGANRKYLNELQMATKPLKRALETNSVPAERQKEIMTKVFAKTIVMGWQVFDEDKGEFVDGIEQPDGKIGKFSVKLVEQTLTNLPSVLEKIQRDAMDMELYLTSLRDEDTKN